MTLTSQPLSRVLEEFRSPAPTPGGGSAAALAGALGASLLSMVAALPRARTTGDDEARRLREAGERCSTLAKALETLIEQDSVAYDRVRESYRLPKTTDAEKAARAARIEETLRVATDVPLEVMRACAAALGESATVLALGNASAASDVKVGVELLGAGLRGAQLNVAINLEGLKDRDYAARAAAESARLAKLPDTNESGGAGAPSGPA
jgi:formiminotetrahydrofolate cyclodeaminase